LDDVDVFAAFKYWRHSNDKVLRILSQAILDRRLFKIEIGNEQFSPGKIQTLQKRAMQKYKLTEDDAAFLVFSDSTSNHAYNPKENQIKIIVGDKELDIAKASDQLKISVLSEKVTKHYVFYPKDLM
jgi:hypothetical protein